MQPQMQKRLALFLTGLCVFALAAPQIAPVSAQATQATVQEILDGNQVFIQNQRASLKDVAKQQQQVRTGNSRTALLFNSGAVARLSANSVLRIGQCARLKRGTILVNGAINACSSGITTGVRGTTYLLTVNESGNQQVQVLEGEVIVKRNATPSIDEDDEPTNKPTDKPTSTAKPSIQKPKVNSPTIQKVKQFTGPPPVSTPNYPALPQDNPQKARPLEPLNATPTSDKPILRVEEGSQPTKQPEEVVLKSGQELVVDNKGVLGLIQQINESDFTALLKGSLFEGFTNQIPGIDKVKAAFEGLFPGANFPISLPNIPIPSIPTPSLPRFPF